MKVTSIGLICAAVALSFSSGVAMDSHSRSAVERSFKVVHGGSISLQTNLGNILVEPSADDSVTIQLVLVGNKEDIDLFTFEVSGDSTNLQFKGRYHDAGRPMDLDIQFFLRIPAGMAGNIDMSSGAGALALRNIQAKSIRGETAAGLITSGDVRGLIDLKVGAGPIRATVHRLDDDMKLTTQAGEIRVEIPDTLSANIDGSTAGAGSVAFVPLDSVAKLSFVSSVESTTHLKGRIHNGGASLRATSGAGNVYFDIVKTK